ncbi:MAG: hypothetical protein CMJ64_17700 [Planctomycetaceae bacterium]|nr:hypothetical protein [Planctomycetaceae bacterium]
MLLDLVLRWMHILGAIMLVGSTIYMRCVHVPAKLLSGDELGDGYNEWQRKMWARLVMLSSAQLLISGLISAILIVQRYEFKTAFPGSVYPALLGVKFLLALAVFFLAAALSGRSSLELKLRQKEKTWLTVNMVLAIVIVCVGGTMGAAKRSEKSATLSRPVESSAQFAPSTSGEASTEIS